MPCYHPMIGYRSAVTSPNGKRPIVFSPKNAYVDLPVKIPCGQCIGCRLEKARQWAVRCMHEAQLHERNCFVTLTFNEESLRPDRSVSKRDIQLFMKRLRKKYSLEEIRYYACGEYGSATARPHYHLCIFGFDFPDKEILYGGKFHHYRNKFKQYSDYAIYRSAALEAIWPFGYSTIGAVSFESAGYVARYIMKKQTGKGVQSNDWENLDSSKMQKPEFALMSRRPGLGKKWFELYKSDVYPKDYFTMKGQKMRPPKYYDYLLDGIDPRMLKDIKNKREAESLKNVESGKRLWAKEKAKEYQTKNLQRGL